MKEKITPYLNNLISLPGIAEQYNANTLKPQEIYNDPLMEDEHEVVKGLVHKYKNRALIKVSYQCAAHCRFCTRIRQIGNPSGTLSRTDIKNLATYLKSHPEIEDVILSGGDPFLTPKLTSQILDEITSISSIKVLRIGSRLALQSPKSFQSKPIKELLTKICSVSKIKPFYILIHANHPNELTNEAISTLKLIKEESGATLLSQTVFLNNVNIDFNTLRQLFKTLYFNSVIPYYIYHCDNVKGLEEFTGNIETEKEIIRQLRDELSGISLPTYIVDLENDKGKYPVDLEMIEITDSIPVRKKKIQAETEL